MKHMITVYPTTQNQVVVAIYKVYVISRGLSLSTKTCSRTTICVRSLNSI